VRSRLLRSFVGAVIVSVMGACGLDAIGSLATTGCDGGECEAGPPLPTGDGAIDACSDPLCAATVDAGAMDAAAAPDASLSANRILWLDAEQIVGLANNGEVASWNDASGMGRNATQTTQSRRPRYMTNVVGGKPAVRFDGTSMFLVVPSFALFPTSSSPLSIIMVLATTSLASQRFVLMQPQTNCTNNFELGYRTGTASRANFGLHAGCSHADVTATNIDMQWHVFTTVIAATGTKPSNVKFFIDGAQVATQLDDATGWPSAGSYGTEVRKLLVGARDDNDNGSYNSYHSGDVAEIMLFDVALDGIRRGAIELALKTKYGL
jgi:hypothetical protein